MSEHSSLRESLTANRELVKPSPGPWGLDESDEDRLTVMGEGDSYAIGAAIYPMERRQLGTSAEGFEEAQANARVFAAGHAMLTAAKAVRETCPCDPDINPEWQAAWQSLLDAIERAERG